MRNKEIPMDLLHSVLYRILPDYEPISKAPTERTRDPIEVNRLYKSIDNHGNVFLIQNPAAWAFIQKGGKGYFHRPKPVFKYSWEQANQLADTGIEPREPDPIIRGANGKDIFGDKY